MRAIVHHPPYDDTAKWALHRSLLKELPFDAVRAQLPAKVIYWHDGKRVGDYGEKCLGLLADTYNDLGLCLYWTFEDSKEYTQAQNHDAHEGVALWLKNRTSLKGVYLSNEPQRWAIGQGIAQYAETLEPLIPRLETNWIPWFAPTLHGWTRWQEPTWTKEEERAAWLQRLMRVVDGTPWLSMQRLALNAYIDPSWPISAIVQKLAGFEWAHLSEIGDHRSTPPRTVTQRRVAGRRSAQMILALEKAGFRHTTLYDLNDDKRGFSFVQGDLVDRERVDAFLSAIAQ